MKRYIRLLNQRGFSFIALIISDVFWCVISFLTAYYIRNNFFGDNIQNIFVYFKAIPWISILLVFVFYSQGLYEQKNRISRISEMYLLLKGISMCLILIMAASFMQKIDYSRILVILFWAFAIFYIGLGRYLIRNVKRKLMKKGYGLINILVVGAGKTGKKLSKNLEDYYEFGYRIRGFLDDKVRPNTNLPYKFLGKTNELRKIIKKRGIDMVFISDPAMAHEEILNLMQECEGENVKFKVVSDLFEIVAGGVDINEIEEIPSLDFQRQKENYIYLVIKRILDFSMALIGIIVLIPFWIFIAIWIKMDSKGSIIFTQERIGLNNKVFSIYKFRTMKQKTRAHAFSPKSSNDSRLTSAGKFLRKTSLDELPQLWNVIKGEMSIVGPRPEMPFIVNKYKSWQRKRLEAKPGITGLWQILGRKDLPLLENIEYDFYYIKNKSLLLDIVIIVKTIAILFSRKGAY